MSRIVLYLTEPASDVNAHVRMGRAMCLLMDLHMRGMSVRNYSTEARAHTQFWKYLKQLEGAGFLLSRLSGKGQAGTTQLLSIPDAPAKAVEEQVLALLRKPMPQ